MKVNAMAYAQLMKLLMDGTRSATELSELTGLHKQTIYDYTRALHKAGVVYIICWEQDILGRDCIPIFMFGNKPDAKRHKLTAAERQANCRARKAKAMTPSLDNWLKPPAQETHP